MGVDAIRTGGGVLGRRLPCRARASLPTCCWSLPVLLLSAVTMNLLPWMVILGLYTIVLYLPFFYYFVMRRTLPPLFFSGVVDFPHHNGVPSRTVTRHYLFQAYQRGCSPVDVRPSYLPRWVLLFLVHFSFSFRRSFVVQSVHSYMVHLLPYIVFFWYIF